MCGICGQFNFGSGAPVKWLHREVSKRLLPSEIIHRKKRGFAVNVVDGWFHQSLDGRIRQYLADPQSQVYGFLEPAAVQSMLRDHAAGRGDHHKILFSIVVLEQWLRSVRGTRHTDPWSPSGHALKISSRARDDCDSNYGAE